jgi:hypothetical protein
MASGYRGEPVHVVITGDAKITFESLNMTVGNEIAQGITRSESQTLLNSIKKKTDLLKNNPGYGIHIPKDRIPKQYLISYEVNNLWKVNLAGAWRIFYTVRGTEVDIIALILDILDHKCYSKKFHYRD